MKTKQQDQREDQDFCSTLMAVFEETFDRYLIESWGRDAGAIQRLRQIHPADFCAALLACAHGDETRSIAGARRCFQRLSGFMPEESSFYERFNPGVVALLKRLFHEALGRLTATQHLELGKVLGGKGVLDVLAIDGCQCTLPVSAAENFPSTHPEHGGIKLTAILSVMYQTLRHVRLTSAREHDRKALRLPRWLHDTLVLIDRGYHDHKLFAQIEDRHGMFLTPLKSGVSPRIVKVHAGLAKAHVGKALDPALPFQRIADFDAEFRAGKQTRVFRVVRLVAPVLNPDGSYRDQVELFFVTNLPRDAFSVEQVATLYRLRWEVESTFKTLKTVARMDQLISANAQVIEAFMYAALLGLVLAQRIESEMRKHDPTVEPSLRRIFMMVIGNLPALIEALPHRRRLRASMSSFAAALWREGVNPNPGRAYARKRYALEFAADR